MRSERLGRNLILREGVVKCFIKRQKKIYEWTAPCQGGAAFSVVDGHKKPTKRLLSWLAEIETALDEKRFEALKQTHIRQHGTTIGGIIESYTKAAVARRTVCGSPTERSARLCVSRLRMIAEDCKLADGDQLDKLTPEAIDGWVDRRVRRWTTQARPREKVVAVARDLLTSARGVFSRWALDAYRREGIEIPECIGQWPQLASTWRPQWQDPPTELKAKTLAKSEKLRKADPATWVLFHVLISFGCRPVDALELTAANFCMLPAKDGKTRRCLSYTPSKTRNANGKRVVIPVPDRVWDALEAARRDCKCDADGFIVPTVPGTRGRATVLENLNKWMRGIGWKRPFFYQGAYVLRKLFTSAVLTEHGEQIASDFCGSSVSMVRRSYGAFFHERLPEVDVTAVISGARE